MKVDEIPGITSEQVERLRTMHKKALGHSRVKINLNAIHDQSILVTVSRTEDLVRKMEAPELYERAAEVFRNNLPEGYCVYITVL